MRTLSREEWAKIEALARRTRDSADQFNKPSNRLDALYGRSHMAARALGYGGSAREWRALTRRILGD